MLCFVGELLTYANNCAVLLGLIVFTFEKSLGVCIVKLGIWTKRIGMEDGRGWAEAFHVIFCARAP